MGELELRLVGADVHHALTDPAMSEISARADKVMSSSKGTVDANAIFRRTVLYNRRMMNTIATENIVIGALASIGVLVLLVMFVYVVRQMFSRKEE